MGLIFMSRMRVRNSGIDMWLKYGLLMLILVLCSVLVVIG